MGAVRREDLSEGSILIFLPRGRIDQWQFETQELDDQEIKYFFVIEAVFLE